MVAAGSINYHLSPGETSEEPTQGAQNFAYLGLFLSLFWGLEVVRNTAHTATAGSVASWLLLSRQPGKPSAAAMRRSLTTSFGSICFGSLVVAVIQTLRQIARAAQRQSAREGGVGQAMLVMCCSFFV